MLNNKLDYLYNASLKDSERAEEEAKKAVKIKKTEASAADEQEEAEQTPESVSISA